MDFLHSILAPCIDNYDVGEDENAQWPNNMISRQAVISDEGWISRRDAPAKTSVSPEEVALCQRLAREAKAVVGEFEVGMGSESGDSFQPFWLVATVGEVGVASIIDEALIRSRFGETLFPPVSVTIEPLEESGYWWEAVADDGWDEDEDKRRDYLRPWRDLIAWFNECPDFTQTAFVCIGDRKALWKLDSNKSALPPGTELTPCCLPRMAVGLTHKGSLCVLFGISVQT